MSYSNPPNPSTSKAIPSLAKRQTSDVTRTGKEKLKFAVTSTLRGRRAPVKQEATTSATPNDSSSSRGRGGSQAGRGRGRGGSHTPLTMTASGPFALGPASAGMSNVPSRRSSARSSAPSIIPVGDATFSARPDGAVPSIAKGKGKAKENAAEEDDDIEVYSDNDEGVEIIDMARIDRMDWMAPEALRSGTDSEKERRRHKVVKLEGRLAKEKESERNASRAESVKSETMDVDVPVDEGGPQVNLANALDLSDSEDDEEMENLVEAFQRHIDEQFEDGGPQQSDGIYFFQFPAPWPVFEPGPSLQPSSSPTLGKRVSFAADVKPPGPSGSTTDATSEASAAPADASSQEQKGIEELPLDGRIGTLLMYKSGAVKIALNPPVMEDQESALASQIILDVSPATAPSFITHAVHVDVPGRTMSVLGEVEKRFVVSVDVARFVGEY